jgi:hypothetical protein
MRTAAARRRRALRGRRIRTRAALPDRQFPDRAGSRSESILTGARSHRGLMNVPNNRVCLIRISTPNHFHNRP